MYIEDDQLTVNGGISIMDLKGSGVAYLGQVTPMMMKKMIVASQVSRLFHFETKNHLCTRTHIHTYTQNVLINKLLLL